MSATVTIARRKGTSKVVHINDVIKGVDKGFECPGCFVELIAVKGDNKEHHFRHGTNLTNSCRETALHLYAKQLLLNESSINFKTGRIDYQNPKAEQRVGIYKSDIAANSLDGEIHFEVIVSHDFVDQEKKNTTETTRLNA